MEKIETEENLEEQPKKKGIRVRIFGDPLVILDE